MHTIAVLKAAVLKANPTDFARAAVAICSLVLIGHYFFWQKFRRWRDARRTMPTMEQLLAGTRGSSRSNSRPYSTVPLTRRPTGNRGEIARLEAHLAQAVFDPGARKRLVDHAMRTTNGDRAAAIRKVLEDLKRENSR